jgi:hypothetical protein
VLTGEARAAIALHQTGSAVAVLVCRRLDPNVARALLHDDADILAGVARLEHLGFVEVENLLERLPLIRGREFGGRPGVPLETHFDYSVFRLGLVS